MIAFAMLFVSCSNELQEEQSTPKTYTVSLGVKGEILDVIQTPLTKSEENNNLYGIQVYSTTSLDEYKYTYKPYAYGLFDDISNVSITLLDGYYYKFQCTMVVSGKKRIDNNNGKFLYPFKFSSKGYNYDIPIENKFNITPEIEMTGLDYGSSSLINDKEYYYPNTDRYYGEISNYQPVEKNTVNIEMKRTVFGVKFIAEGLTEGRLKITMDGAPELYINSKDSKHEIEDIFTFGNLWNATNNDNYSEDINTSIYWEKADGTEVPIAVNYTLTFTRKMMHTIRVNLAGTSTKGESPISITLEDGALGTGKDYTIGETQN